jgi:hypothetical protein
MELPIEFNEMLLALEAFLDNFCLIFLGFVSRSRLYKLTLSASPGRFLFLPESDFLSNSSNRPTLSRCWNLFKGFLDLALLLMTVVLFLRGDPTSFIDKDTSDRSIFTELFSSQRTNLCLHANQM